MIIPMFGDDCNKVSWFKWSTGLEFTYFIGKSVGFCNNIKIITSTDKRFLKTMINYPFYELSVDDHLLNDGFLKEKGYPLKGRGYICGIEKEEDTYYADIILTDKYYQHLTVECDDHGYYKGGIIKWPTVPSMETIEGRKNYLLKEHYALAMLN